MDFKTTAELDIENPVPGIYVDVPDSKYFKINAINNSQLNTLINKSAAHLSFERENPDYSSTDAQLLGSVAHLLLLQEDQFEDRIKLLPEGNANSNKWKLELMRKFPEAPLSKNNKKAENMALIEEHYPDIVLADKDKVATAKAMIEKMRHEDREYYEWKLHNIMKSGRAEVVFIWKDEKTGLLLKCKFDWINFEIKLGMDYKSTADASPQKFRYSISDYGYHRQLIHYFKGARASEVDLRRNVILAQESKLPYQHVWYEFDFDPDSGKARGNEFKVAEYQWRGALNYLARCIAEDRWPGYVNGRGDNVLPIVLKYDDYFMYSIDPFEAEDTSDVDDIFKDPLKKLQKERMNMDTENDN